MIGNEWLPRLTIDDDDILWSESVLGNDISFDEERRAVIKNMESIDVQAFPGSGKTTALIGKLAILAKKWTDDHAGICVLSHTNVARSEIEKRLGQTDVGSKLLNYPHFIGTIHTFIYTYVALPWVRSKGYPIHLIDTEYAKRYRWNRLSYRSKEFLLRKLQNENLCCFPFELGTITWTKQEEHKNKVIDGIYESHRRGIFTHDEMMLYGKQALQECDQLAISLQSRFPFVFIDEAQDTNALQWDLIHTIFPDGSVVRQGFGDQNQAIYNNVNEKAPGLGFPRDNPLSICSSRRFDNRIAILANSIAITGERMTGTDNEFSLPEKSIDHTIFLFKRNSDSIRKVVAEFGKLIINTFDENEIAANQDKGIHVIGMVHNKKEETEEDHFPKYISDYWPEYKPERGNRSINPKRLIGYCRLGQYDYSRTGELQDYISSLSKGLKQLIVRSSSSTPQPNLSHISIFNIVDENDRFVFRELLMDIVSKDAFNKADWDLIRSRFLEILVRVGCIANSNTLDFLEWEDSNQGVDESGGSYQDSDENCYLYHDKETNRSVSMKFGSIHSVKGRTHLATLVLETFWHEHNIESLIPLLCGKDLPKTAKRIQQRQKIHYVAMTRAKALLCIAIPEEFVGIEEQRSLESLGWKIHSIE